MSMEVDLPPEAGHAVPQWLRDRFDAIELETRKMGAEGVFTQMRTKVQAYFEMLRSVESGRAGRDLAIITQQKNLISSLRDDLQLAILIGCGEDVSDAIEEVERTGTPGDVIREMNDELVELRAGAEFRQWMPMDTCPKHKDVMFYRVDAGVFTGQLTYCEAFMSEKEVEESDYDEQTLYAEDVFSFGPDGAYRCDGDLVPTHWMPFPVEPSE